MTSFRTCRRRNKGVPVPVPSVPCQTESGGSGYSPTLQQPSRPPIYDAFSPEDRALFVDCKQRLGPIRMNELIETAVEWLTELAGGDPDGFADEVLRDQVDELVFYEVFGPERRRPYEGYFMHLYRL